MGCGRFADVRGRGQETPHAAGGLLEPVREARVPGNLQPGGLLLGGTQVVAPGRAAALVLRQQQQHLAGGDERDPTTGARWPAWSASYVAAGAPFDGDHRLLLRSQDLLNSLKIGRVGGTRGTVTATVGTDSAYARTHQEGRGPIPSRAFMGVSDDDLDELEQLAAVFIADLIERAAA